MTAYVKKSFLRKQKLENGFIKDEITTLQYNIRIAGLLPKTERSCRLLDVMDRIEIRLKDPNTEKMIRDAIIVALPLLYLQIYLLKREA